MSTQSCDCPWQTASIFRTSKLHHTNSLPFTLTFSPYVSRAKCSSEQRRWTALHPSPFPHAKNICPNVDGLRYASQPEPVLPSPNPFPPCTNICPNADGLRYASQPDPILSSLIPFPSCANALPTNADGLRYTIQPYPGFLLNAWTKPMHSTSAGSWSTIALSRSGTGELKLMVL